jgi:DNA-binding response OmpR family regulator
MTGSPPMAPTIAFVDDETDLRDAVAEYLTDRGLRVLTAESGAAFRAIAATEVIDVAVLDIAMPGEDGLSLGRWFASREPRPGLIFATAAEAPMDRIAGLELGADDYIVKPFALRELLARIRSVLRRPPDHGGPKRRTAETASGGGPPATIITVGPFRLDRESCRLVGPAGAVQLTAAEADLLAVLASRPHRVLTRPQLLSLAGGSGAESDERSIDSRIVRLRRKLAREGVPSKLIQSVRGEGYMFAPGEV